MDFLFNDEQQQIAQSLARLLDDQCSFEQRRAIAASATGWSAELWAGLTELGLTALGIPEAFGGLGGGAVDRLPVLQALGSHLALEPYLGAVVLGGTVIREAASEAQKDALLPQIAAGRLLPGFAHDESAARHAALWVETRARQQDGQWVLDGEKPLVLHAGAATRIVVTARTHGAPDDEDGLALFLVDPHSTGVALRTYRLVDDTPAGGIRLTGTAGEPLGDPSNSLRAAAALRATLAAGTAAVCADMVGAMEAALALTTGYVNTRKQFGRVIGEYQSLRHRVADMVVGLEMARSMAMAAAVAADAPHTAESATDLASAKLVIGRHARALAEAAIQSHGGIGMTEEYAVGHCLRRIHVLDQLFGDVDAQAARLVGMRAP